MGKKTGDSKLLFFIIIYLLLFYDSSFIGAVTGNAALCNRPRNNTALFFILIFLLLFY